MTKLEQAARQAFETWWEREGQEFLFALNTTTDDDIKLVAKVAWKNGAYCAEQAEQEPSKQQKALQELKEWQRAYPLSVFPEPDCTKAQQALESVGMTLDSLSASTLRWALERVMKIVEEALAAPIEVECNEAVLAEREACAKVCEEYDMDHIVGQQLAAAIRARGDNGSH